MKHKQLGGTLAGILIGLVIGLGIAIAVAMVTSKMPIPFINSTANTRPSTLDAAEEERNRNWNPNASLAGTRTTASGTNTTPTPAPTTPANPSTPGDSTVVAIAPPTTPAGGDPLGELASRLSRPDANNNSAVTAPPASGGNAASASNFQYFVQAGAFRSQADADSQRARLAMLGWDAKVSQSQNVFRVRVGPFGRSEDATNLKRQLDGQGMDSAVVRQAR